jgi:N6-L-threonylcarbamoyladenine synthase
LLKQKKAKVTKKVPFTIQLLYGSSGYKQPISLGVDAGSKHIGISATTEKEVLFEADVELRNDIVDLLSTRREARRNRRHRKTRYRKPRFLNRIHTKKKGWLAPSIRQKIETHLTAIARVHRILPISKIIVEVASFDIQKIRNPEISGVEYQQGEQMGFWNAREYVLFRDGHTCQCCKGKSKDKILNVHHIESRKTGGDAPNNLITLCETCHDGYHKGTVKLPASIKRGMKFRDATFMGIMRWAFYNKLKVIYSNVSLTYGYITKHTRITNHLPKDHYIDARCISGNPMTKSNGVVFYLKKIRRHNRQIFKAKTLKGGQRKRNQCNYVVFGFRRYDLVEFEGKICYINSLRTNGSFLIQSLTDTNFKRQPTYKKLKLIQVRDGFITQPKFIKDGVA